MTDKPPKRRNYNSPIRQQQRENTRHNIISAGADLVYDLPTWDMQTLTFKAVGEKANVSERTVYRYFSTERELKDAIVEHLVTESGIDLNTLKLENFADITAHFFGQLTAYAASSTPEVDPTFANVDKERRTALLRATTEATPHWSAQDQLMTAALLDTLWDIVPFQRLLSTWGLDTQQAIQSTTWLIELVQDAIKNNHKPSDHSNNPSD